MRMYRHARLRARFPTAHAHLDFACAVLAHPLLAGRFTTMPTSTGGMTGKGRRVKKLAAPIPRVALTIPEAAAAIGVGVDFFDEHVRPELRVIRRGSKRLIPVAELERWADENAERTLGARSRSGRVGRVHGHGRLDGNLTRHHETRRLASAQPIKGESRMTAKHSSRPCQPTALGRRFRIAVSALALSTMIGLGAGASQSVAATGSVYFDNNFNAAAGDPNFLFNGTFTGAYNVGLGHAVMPNLTSGERNIAVGTNALNANTTGTENVATGDFALTPIPPASTMSPAAARRSRTTQPATTIASGFRALWQNVGGSNTSPSASPRSSQHGRQRQRRRRHGRAP